jgi:hypothetical protein
MPDHRRRFYQIRARLPITGDLQQSLNQQLSLAHPQSVDCGQVSFLKPTEDLRLAGAAQPDDAGPFFAGFAFIRYVSMIVGQCCAQFRRSIVDCKTILP